MVKHLYLHFTQTLVLMGTINGQSMVNGKNVWRSTVLFIKFGPPKKNYTRALPLKTNLIYSLFIERHHNLRKNALTL